MPKSRKLLKSYKAKFKVGDQVIFRDEEYFVTEPDSENRSFMKLLTRFKPYAKQFVCAQRHECEMNTESMRRNCQPGDWVLFDFDSHQALNSKVLYRTGDDITIQPKHVRHTFTLSVFSNRVKCQSRQPDDSYVTRMCGLSNELLQARVYTIDGRLGTIIDYETLPDRYLLVFNGGIQAPAWVKRDDFTVETMDKDPFVCDWDKIGTLRFTFNDLYELGTSYFPECDMDMESLKQDLWYRVQSTGHNHFARNYGSDLDMFTILLWLENHEYYWKRNLSVGYYSEEMLKDLDYNLIDSLMSAELIDTEIVYRVSDRLQRSLHERRRADHVETVLRGRPIFKTTLERTGNTFTVHIYQPKDPQLRCLDYNKQFLYDYVAKVLWYQSTRPIAPSWVETRQLKYDMPIRCLKVEMKVPLKQFQERIVLDMLHRELHPIEPMSLTTNSNIRFNVINGFGCTLPVRGGILSLDTGMGKTVCTLALINATKHIVKSTLIVLPLTIIDQWITELTRFTDLTYTQVHGRHKLQPGKNVIFTTYGTLLSTYNKYGPGSDMFMCDRVIFDESHQQKNFNSCTVQACWAVNAPHKWCLTATPFRRGAFINIHAQMKMLGVRPLHERENYFKYITETECPRSRWILHRLSKLIIKPDLEEFISIPEPVKQYNYVSRCIVSNRRRLYDFMYEKTVNKLKELLENGTIHTHYSHVMSLLNQLSICAIDPLLVPVDAWGERCVHSGISTTTIETLTGTLDNSQFQIEVKEKLDTLEDTTCCLCLENVVRPTITPCLHIFCHDCIKRSMEFKRTCPMCRALILEDDFREIKTSVDAETLDGYTYFNDRYGRRVKVPDQVVQCYKEEPAHGKFDKLLDIIKERNKVVVYSQFNTVLEDYSKRIDCSIITGKSTRAQRKKNIEKFKHSDTKVFFLSTKVADIGINLTEADTLVFLEPGLESDVETQALGRLKRIGQEKTIHVHTIIQRDTIEVNIKNERSMYDEAMGHIMASDGSKAAKTKKKRQVFLNYIIRVLQV